MQRVIDYSAYLGLRLFICFVQSLRIETCATLAEMLATLFGRVLGVRRKVVERNLRLAFPELTSVQRKRLAWRMWRHLFLLVAEVAHAPRKIHETNWRTFVAIDEPGPLVRRLLSGRPTLIVAAHYGNFEVCGYIMGLLGFPTYTVARPLDNPYLDRFIARFRGATGQHIIPKKGGYEQILAVLARGGAMTFLADQYAGSKSCWVKFFGAPASAHKAIGLLALDNDAPVAVGHARRGKRPMHFVMSGEGIVDPRVDNDICRSVKSLTQWYTDTFEQAIRRDPSQYWWLHDRWKDRRDKDRKARRAA